MPEGGTRFRTCVIPQRSGGARACAAISSAIATYAPHYEMLDPRLRPSLTSDAISQKNSQACRSGSGCTRIDPPLHQHASPAGKSMHSQPTTHRYDAARPCLAHRKYKVMSLKAAADSRYQGASPVQRIPRLLPKPATDASSSKRRSGDRWRRPRAKNPHREYFTLLVRLCSVAARPAKLNLLPKAKRLTKQDHKFSSRRSTGDLHHVQNHAHRRAAPRRNQPGRHRRPGE